MRQYLFHPLVLALWTLVADLVAEAHALPQAWAWQVNEDVPPYVDIGYYTVENDWECDSITIPTKWIEDSLDHNVGLWHHRKSEAWDGPWKGGYTRYPHQVETGFKDWTLVETACDTKYVGSVPIVEVLTEGDQQKTAPGRYRALISWDPDRLQNEGVDHLAYNFCGVAMHSSDGDDDRYVMCAEATTREKLGEPEQLVLS